MRNPMISSLLKSINESVDKTLRKTTLTLGNFIEKLEALPVSKQIIFSYPSDNPEQPNYKIFGLGSLDSYRGYYKYLAIEPSEHIGTVKEALQNAKEAVNQTYEGYKGGDYEMDTNTLIWCANWGSASGLKIVDVIEEDQHIIVKTMLEKDEEFDYDEMATKAEKKMHEDIDKAVIEAARKKTK